MSISRKTMTAAALAALVATAGAASAQGFGGGNWYGKGFGGFTFPSSEDANIRQGNDRTGEQVKFNYDTGYTLGASVGYLYTPNVALELEYAYRKADATGRVTESGSTVLKDNGGDTTANSLMFNALYLFDAMGPNAAWQPYVGAGIGGANVDTEMFGDTWSADNVFAYQFIGGVGYEVAPNWTLFGEARYFGTQNSDYDTRDDFNFDGGFSTVDLLVGAKLSF